MNHKTLCIILHYGEEEVTWDCVASIPDNARLDILIVDNDPSQKIEILDSYKGRARLFRTGGIAGFAHANNMAIQYARSKEHDSVLLLNNDTVVLNDALEKLQSLLSQDDVGIVGPCMPYASDPEKIWACGGVIERSNVTVYGLKSIKKVDPYDVDYLPGAAILCRMEVWDLAGGLPEKYFLAYEEAEFAIRVRERGYRVMVHPGTKILHKVGMSSDRQPMYLYNGNRNRLRFGKVIRGRYLGFPIAAFWCLVGARKSLQGLMLCFRAFWDELRGVPLDRATLQGIKKTYAR
jgi:GT2 family glycosyltransferase